MATLSRKMLAHMIVTAVAAETDELDVAQLAAINDAQEQLIKASARIVFGVIAVIVTLAFFIWPSKKQLVATLLTKVRTGHHHLAATSHHGRWRCASVTLSRT